MAIRAWLLAGLLALWSCASVQAAVLDVSGVERVELATQLSLLEDPGAALDLAAARQAEGYAPAAGRTSFGFTASAWWARVRLDNPGDAPVQVFLRQDYPLIDELEVWTVRGGTVADHFATGDRRPFDNRPIAHRDFVFPLVLPPRSQTTAYLRLRTDGALNLGLSLYRPSALVEQVSQEQLAFGLYFGGFLVLIVYNLFIFLAVRDRAFLYYLAYVASYGLYFSIHNGLSFQFFWPQAPAWANTSLLVTLALALVFGLQFTRSFLDARRLAPRLDRVAFVLQGLGVLALIAAFFAPYRALIVPLAYLTFAITVMILSLGVVGLLRRVVSARYFMIAWGTLLLGVLVYMLKTFGWLPHNALTQNGFQIGSLLEMVLLSLALAHRVRELSQLSRTDPLTKLLNRRAFDDCLEREFDRRQKGRAPVALLVADIDNFKQVNDGHGHAFGDKVLGQVADVLRSCVDGRDVVGRYGGEEFAILFPGLDREAALTRAEHIRHAIQERVSAPMPITLSVGVAVCEDDAFENPNALFRAADAALYRAKDSGRNRVVDHASMRPAVLA